MNKNKIVGNLFKKLLHNNFSREEIRDFLFVYEQFNSFSNFIYYLFQLSNHSESSDKKNQMACSVKSYLTYLVDVYHIEGYNYSDLKKHQIYHEIEINALSETNNVLNLSNKEVDQYKNILFIVNPIFLKREYYVFRDNEYLGYYHTIKHTNYFIDDLQVIATVLFEKDATDDYHWKEINNFIISKYWNSLAQLKSNMVSLLNRNKIIDNSIYDTIYNSTNHFSCFNAMINFLMWSNHKELFGQFINDYEHYLKTYQFKIDMLFDDISILSAYELTLISNSYNILAGNQVSVADNHDVFLVLDKITFNDINQVLLPFYPYKENKLFDYQLNQLIMNSLKHENKIYLFEKKKNDSYLYKGTYRVKGIELSEPSKPQFKLSKTMPEINLIPCYEIDNAYQNVFYEKLHDQNYYERFSNQFEVTKIKKQNIKELLMNSLLYKYNWVVNKFINTGDYNYSFAFQKFDTKILLNISNILNYKLLFLFEEKVISNWVIATELLKKNNCEELLSISYYGNDIDINEQNEILKKYL